jgi:hypothetical protein
MECKILTSFCQGLLFKVEMDKVHSDTHTVINQGHFLGEWHLLLQTHSHPPSHHVLGYTRYNLKILTASEDGKTLWWEEPLPSHPSKRTPGDKRHPLPSIEETYGGYPQTPETPAGLYRVPRWRQAGWPITVHKAGGPPMEEANVITPLWKDRVVTTVCQGIPSVRKRVLKSHWGILWGEQGRKGGSRVSLWILQYSSEETEDAPGNS